MEEALLRVQHLPEGLLLQQALRQESPTCLSLQAAIEAAPPSTVDNRLHTNNKDLQGGAGLVVKHGEISTLRERQINK